MPKVAQGFWQQEQKGGAWMMRGADRREVRVLREHEKPARDESQTSGSVDIFVQTSSGAQRRGIVRRAHGYAEGGAKE